MASSFILHIVFCCNLIVSLSIHPCSSANLRALTIAPNPQPQNPPKTGQNETKISPNPHPENPYDQNRTEITGEYAFKIASHYANKTLSFIRDEIQYRAPYYWISQLQKCQTVYERITFLMDTAMKQLPIVKEPILLALYPANCLIKLRNCSNEFPEESHHPLVCKNARMYSLIRLTLSTTR